MKKTKKNNKIKTIKKVVAIDGITERQRNEELKKVKKQLIAKGYLFIRYIDNGFLKSYAVFIINSKILLKNKLKKYLLIGAPIILFIFVVGFGFSLFKSFESQKTIYSIYKKYTIKDAKSLSEERIKEISYSYAETNAIPSSYNNTMYNCFADMLYFNNNELTAQQVLTFCKDDYQNKSNKVYVNMIELKKGFNPQTGSYIPLEMWIKQNMRNVDSYKHVETKYRILRDDNRPYMVVGTIFTSNNDFGAIITNKVTAKVDIISKKLLDINWHN